MNEKVKKIEELKRRISYINFQNYLSPEDYAAMDELEAEIERLKAEVKGLKGIAVHVKYKDTEHFGDKGWYLTDDDVLCCGNEPVPFDSREEAEKQLEKAKLDPDDYEFEFEEVTL